MNMGIVMMSFILMVILTRRIHTNMNIPAPSTSMDTCPISITATKISNSH